MAWQGRYAPIGNMALTSFALGVQEYALGPADNGT